MINTWSRRQRRIALTVLISGTVALIVGAVVIFKPSPKPYVPGEPIEGLTDELSRSLPSDYPPVTYTDVSLPAGIDFRHFSGQRTTQLPEDMGSGAAWGDYDRDGWLDLYVVNEVGPLTMSAQQIASSPAHNVLYRNRGDGTFEDVTAQAGVGYRGCGQAAAWGDYDNDGFLDLIVTNYGVNVLYHNRGDGTFADTSEEAGIGGVEGYWAGASWGDYNRDGTLDLYVCGYVQYSYEAEAARAKSRQYDAPVPAALNPSTYEPHRNLLFCNKGDGTFRDVTHSAGVENLAGRSLSATWCDFDDDGWPDLYVANDVSDNVLFHNRGDGTFEDISHNAWVADYRGAMGLAVGDWDGDQDMDLFVTHWIAQENALYNNMLSDFADVRAGGGAAVNFTDVADQFGLGQIALDYIGWGTAFVDFNNDGRLDLFVVNGSTFQQNQDPRFLAPMRMLLFWNRGPQDGFFEVGTVSGEVFSKRYVGRGLAVGDYDNDGDNDAFVVVNGGSAMLLKNEGGNANYWLKVRTIGRASNRFGVGAKLRLAAGDVRAMREVGSGSSYYSQNAVGEELFGLGKAERVDSLVITWPSGAIQILSDIAVNQVLVVTEDEQTGIKTGSRCGQ
ncbi:MAG: CRTAC1 family protein [Candidatus Krumholzibacteria bacterium]|nr:CRTAC1 family protein [Candidatus Krumholzibacteria bacterium]